MSSQPLQVFQCSTGDSERGRLGDQSFQPLGDVVACLLDQRPHGQAIDEAAGPVGGLWGCSLSFNSDPLRYVHIAPPFTAR